MARIETVYFRWTQVSILNCLFFFFLFTLVSFQHNDSFVTKQEARLEKSAIWYQSLQTKHMSFSSWISFERHTLRYPFQTEAHQHFQSSLVPGPAAASAAPDDVHSPEAASSSPQGM